MRAVTRYQADDGSVWVSEKQALERDALVEKCQKIPRYLGMHDRPESDGCDYENGGGFIQQPTGTREKLVNELRALGWNRDSDGPVGLLSYRAQCLDDSDREWGQPYFATHPQEAKAIAL